MLFALAPAICGLRTLGRGVFWSSAITVGLCGCRLPGGPSAGESVLASNPHTLPRLDWRRRSDWLDVRAAGAVGDGIADDTVAVQAALSSLAEGSDTPKVVYFPPGIYRITETLEITYRRPNTKDGERGGGLNGALLIGHGRDTVLAWDGSEGGRLLWSNGSARCRYVGLVFDGRGRAAVGVDHHGVARFETRVRYQHCGFRNFTTAGVRVGHAQTEAKGTALASAEMLWENCLFRDNGSGALFLQWNDYDNSFDGCHFIDNDIGVNCRIGNVYVRNSRFERSRETDIFVHAHSHSVRRSLSVGSRAFITTSQGSSGHCELFVEGCRIEGWTGDRGALSLGLRGPFTLVDNEFAKPPDGAPPIRLVGTARHRQLVVASGNVVDGEELLDFGPDNRHGSNVVEIPSGVRTATVPARDTAFLKPAVRVPARVLDAKTDFGAVGNGATDDTEALQRAIDRAREQGGGTLVYLPTGIYRITRPLVISGRDYAVGGSGWQTVLDWKGPVPAGQNAGDAAESAILRVADADGVTIEHLRLQAPSRVAGLVHTDNGGQPARVTYDGVYVPGTYARNSREPIRGAEFHRLPATVTVHAPHVDGSLHFHDSAAATFLVNVSYDGQILVDGATSPKTGFLGFLTRLATVNHVDITVRDNNDLVVSDFYFESTTKHLRAEGGTRLEAGRITVMTHKSGTEKPLVYDIDNYEGRIVYGGGQYMYQTPTRLEHRGERPLALVFFGNLYWKTPGDEPVFELGPGAQLTAFQNLYYEGPQQSLPNRFAPGGLEAAAAALDDLRELGALDWRLNHAGPAAR